MTEENCTHDCSTCGESCSSREQSPASFLENPHPMSSVKKVIGIVSGKGGVGKSLVTSLLSVMLNRKDYKTAILDADITGPSIPKMFGIREKAVANDWGLLPARSKTGIDIMSINLLLEKETDPVVWRGPVIGGVVKQFWTDVVWSDVDYMFVDMPPGTGDVALTVFQSLPVDGIIIVTSPQDLVSMIVGKALSMAGMMNIPVLGIVENMSYFVCPDCDKQHAVFGDSKLDEVAANYGIDVIGRIPINPILARSCDEGLIELFEGDWLTPASDKLEILFGSEL